MKNFIKLSVRLTKAQREILEAKATAAGFTSMAGYVRNCLFLSMPTETKIDKIYRKVVLNETD
jgi:hypothetical protein